MAQSDTAATASSTRNIDFAGYALAIGGAVFFSTKGIFIKLAYQAGIGAETLLALRMMVALPFYVVIGTVLVLRDPEMRARLDWRAVAGSALVGILGYYCASLLDFSGLAFLSAQYERLVLFTYPFFTLALGILFFGDSMVWRAVPALVVSYAGLLVIFGWNLATRPGGIVMGTALVLASGITFALYQHLARRRMTAIGSRMFTCIAMTAAGATALAANTVQNGLAEYGSLRPTIWGYGLALGLMGTVVPSFMLNGAIARIGARAAASTGTWGPVATIVLAVIVLGEPFTVFHAAGTALVIGGSVLFARAIERARAAG